MNLTDSDRMNRDCNCSWNCSLHADNLSWLDKRFLDTFDSKAATNAGTEIHRVDRMDRMVDCYEVADCSGCESDQSLLEMGRKHDSHEKLLDLVQC